MNGEFHPDLPPQNLESTSVVRQLLPKAIALLESDFRFCGKEIGLHPDDPQDPFSVREKLKQELERSGGAGTEFFHQLMYRADLPENSVKEAFRAAPGEDPLRKISELLIIRALQRSWYRQKYTP